MKKKHIIPKKSHSIPQQHTCTINIDVHGKVYMDCGTLILTKEQKEEIEKITKKIAAEVVETYEIKEIKYPEDIIQLKDRTFFFKIDGKEGAISERKLRKTRETPKLKEYLYEKLFGDLYEECEIEDEKKYHLYIDEFDKCITDITKLKSSDTKILVYTSGKRCLYDLIMNEENRGLSDYEKIFLLALIKSPKKMLKCFLKIPKYGFLFLKKKKALKYFSKKILGLYDTIPFDIQFPERPEKCKIKIISTNIENTAKERKYNLEDLEKYVVMHEDIHNRQFMNFPEIEKQRFELIKRYMFSWIIKNVYGGIKEFPLKEIKKIEKETKEKIDILMCTIEGHAEFFTNKIAEEYLPNLKFERKYSFFERLKYKFYGIEEIKERYEKGSKFISYLYSKGGANLANLPFERHPESMEEIENPETYFERIFK